MSDHSVVTAPVDVDANDDLAMAKHRLARAREIGARNPDHFQNVGLQHKHIVALLAALAPGEA